jgi:hypothetical protein
MITRLSLIFRKSEKSMSSYLSRSLSYPPPLSLWRTIRGFYPPFFSLPLSSTLSLPSPYFLSYFFFSISYFFHSGTETISLSYLPNFKPAWMERSNTSPFTESYSEASTRTPPFPIWVSAQCKNKCTTRTKSTFTHSTCACTN